MSMAMVTENFASNVEKLMRNAVGEWMDQTYEEEKKRVLKRLDDEKETALAAMTLRFMHSMDIQTLSDRMIITLRTEKV